MSNIENLHDKAHVSLKSILERIREVSEILDIPIDRLDAVNHGPSTEKAEGNAGIVPSSTLDEIMAVINSVEKKASTLQKETGLLVGN